MELKKDLVACFGEFCGTTLFLMLALGGAKTAQISSTTADEAGLQAVLSNQTLMYISLSFGMSLLVTAWIFYRITGGLFNPAITLALFLVGPLGAFRAILLFVSQILGGIAAAALVAGLTSFGGVANVETRLGVDVNIAQGLFVEAFLTLVLVLTVLFLAVEKHKGTYLAPVGIGLALFSCHLFGIAWTGCGMNPARSFGPSVVSGTFPNFHWIYWLGPLIGTLVAVAFYQVLKMFDYEKIVFAQDASAEEAERLEKQMPADEEKQNGGSTQRQSSYGSGAQEEARGRVIMVHKRNICSEIHHGEQQEELKSIDGHSHFHGPGTMVDLDAVTFYECESGTGHK